MPKLFQKTGLCVSFLLAVALSARGVTPEAGKERLRKLVKLPTVSFQASWSFDPERGFIIGSGEQEKQISDLRKELKHEDGDAQIYLEIGKLYSGANDVAKARGALARAAQLFRKQADLRPDDCDLLASFGEALAGSGKANEAESVLRRAALLAPTDWKPWVALGRFLDAEARRAIFARELSNDNVDPDADSERPSSDLVSQSRKWIEEAGDCYDKAVSAGPEEAEAYFRRAMHRCLGTMLLNKIKLDSGDPGADANLLNDCFPAESLADLRRASRLNPRDYRLIGGVELFEIYSVTAAKGQVNWGEFSWNSLPDKSQRSMDEAISRLTDMGQGARHGEAAGALEVLGTLQGPVLRETQPCIENLRRALTLDPSREQCWEMLSGALAGSARYDELLDICAERVRRKDSARGRLLLAKAHEKLRQWNDCETEVRAALKRDPDDFNASLSLANLMLKRAGDDTALSDANTWLARAEYILNNKVPPHKRTQQQRIDLTLTRGIYYGLTDETEMARQWVKAVLELDKENKLARDILDALGN